MSVSSSLSLTAAVQHHPSRADLLPDLLARLDGLDPAVVEDPGGPRPGTWRTHRACLEQTPDHATHLMVIQDDAAPCADFATRAQAAVEEQPDPILALFAPGFAHLRRLIRNAHTAGERFVLIPHSAFVPVVCIVYPREHVDALLAYTRQDAWPKRSFSHADDSVVAGYCRTQRVRAYATVPSLVEHRDDLPSIAKPAHRPAQHRRAVMFAD